MNIEKSKTEDIGYCVLCVENPYGERGNKKSAASARILNGLTYKTKEEAQKAINDFYDENSKEGCEDRMSVSHEEFKKINNYIKKKQKDGYSISDSINSYNEENESSYNEENYLSDKTCYNIIKNVDDPILTIERVSNMFKYPYREVNSENMDSKCSSIVNALNEIRGVKVISSTRGSEKENSEITFESYDNYSVSIIARAISERYTKTEIKWRLEVETVDFITNRHSGFIYKLKSDEPYKTDKAFKNDINTIVGEIRMWSNPQFEEHFNGKINEK